MGDIPHARDRAVDLGRWLRLSVALGAWLFSFTGDKVDRSILLTPVY